MSPVSKVSLAALALAALAPAAQAQTASQPSPEVMRAMMGPWTALGGTPQQQTATGQAPPANSESVVNDRRFPPALYALLKPWAKVGWDKYRAEAIAVTKGEREKEPPTPDNNCMPFSMPGESISINFPMTIQINPTTVAIYTQVDTQLRIVHMNGKHPANLKPSFHGHSIGRWEGDTLVIDSIGFDDRAQFNDGIIHSPKLHVTERYRVIDDGKTIEKTYTYEDADAFTGPYTITRKARRFDQDIQEYLNAQNNTLYECPTAEHGTKYQPPR